MQGKPVLLSVFMEESIYFQEILLISLEYMAQNLAQYRHFQTILARTRAILGARFV